MLSIFVSILVCLYLLNVVFPRLCRARKFRDFYRRQGIHGPPFRFVVGNLPELQQLSKSVSKSPQTLDSPTKLRVTPDLCALSKDYGKVSIHEVGSTTRLILDDYELVKQVLIKRASCYKKAELSREALKELIGNGVVFSEGHFWRQQRKILNPAFKMSYLKGLTRHMYNAGGDLTRRWSTQIDTQGGEACIDVQRDMAALTLDVIARSAFGSTNSGYKAFECLDKLLSYGLSGMTSYERLIPGYKLFPTARNIKLWKSERYVNKLLMGIIKNRWKEKKNMDISSTYAGSDLLDMMLEAVKNKSPTMTMEQLLDECKTIFFAGHSTTALTLNWTLIMLSAHKDWQTRARQEVLAELEKSGGSLDVEHLSNLHIVGCIINEVLRLYPPVSSVSRQCEQAHTIGNYLILPGTVVMLPIISILQSENIWGTDAYRFNPDRFINKSVKELPEFIVFGAGPRMCMGMNFALMEAKVLLAMLLKEFTFDLSPDYCHCPGSPLSMKPVHGARLIIKKLQC